MRSKRRFPCFPLSSFSSFPVYVRSAIFSLCSFFFSFPFFQSLFSFGFFSLLQRIPFHLSFCSSLSILSFVSLLFLFFIGTYIIDRHTKTKKNNKPFLSFPFLLPGLNQGLWVLSAVPEYPRYAGSVLVFCRVPFLDTENIHFCLFFCLLGLTKSQLPPNSHAKCEFIAKCENALSYRIFKGFRLLGIKKYLHFIL